MNLLAYILAIVLFLLAGLSVTVGDATQQTLICWGLAAFALAHILPPRP